MKTCKSCGKKGLFLALNGDGLCAACAEAKRREILRQEEWKRREEKEARERKEAWAKILAVPARQIKLSDVPIKRRRGFEELTFSNITAKGNYDDIVVIDTETTGLAPSRDRIAELAAVRFSHGQPVETFHSFINPEREMPKSAQMINHLKDELLAEAPKIGQVLPSFDEFCGASTLVGHNLEFDVKFLFYSGSTITDQKRKYIDTLAQARRFLKRPKWDEEEEGYDYESDYDVEDYQLDTLCFYYRIKRAKDHGAFSDAFATGELFFKLVDEKR